MIRSRLARSSRIWADRDDREAAENPAHLHAQARASVNSMNGVAEAIGSLRSRGGPYWKIFAAFCTVTQTPQTMGTPTAAQA